MGVNREALQLNGVYKSFIFYYKSWESVSVLQVIAIVANNKTALVCMEWNSLSKYSKVNFKLCAYNKQSQILCRSVNNASVTNDSAALPHQSMDYPT